MKKTIRRAEAANKKVQTISNRLHYIIRTCRVCVTVY